MRKHFLVAKKAELMKLHEIHEKLNDQIQQLRQSERQFMRRLGKNKNRKTKKQL